MYAGDLEGARRVLARYAAVSPGDANVQDTLGDVHFHFGRFDEAEKYYPEAHRLNPGLLSGGDLYRAAIAARFASDLRGADSHIANWLTFRKRGGDPVLAIREAAWEASTARLSQGRTRLRQLAQVPGLSAERRNAVPAQLAILDRVAGERTVAPARAGDASAAVAYFSATAMPLPLYAYSGPNGCRQQYERRCLATHCCSTATSGKQCRLAGGVPVGPPTNYSDARVMLAWSLHGSGQVAEASRLLAQAPIPRARGRTWAELPDPAQLR
ncbi:MAG TPA: hypothetical protein VFL57_00715 [Bryobacteraceae bacterium]|nr:hypothetical protein [Bryobacteraceae bacterium]